VSDRPLTIGVDLGGTKIETVVADSAGNVLGEDLRPTLADQGGPPAVIARIADSVHAACGKANVRATDTLGIGISSPGPAKPKEGIVTDAPNLPGWHDIHVTKLLSEAVGVPILLENDANAAAYGECRFGAAVGLQHIVYVTLGTGIGGGIIIDGKIYEGASGAAGEVGHMVVLPDGPVCNCGNRGCVEALSAGPAIARDAAALIQGGKAPKLAELASDEPPTAKTVLAAAQQGDDEARDIIYRAGYYLGLGLTGLLNVFDPQALILGGGLVNLGDLYLGPAIETARKGAFPQIVADVLITTAKLGNRAGALGAAALVISRPPT
jgi:glucokinase